MRIFVKNRAIYVFVFLIFLFSAFSNSVLVKAEAGNYYLSMGEYLSAGMRITSLNGKYFAIMQTDGNFVIYQSDTQKALWHTNTYGGNYTSYRAIMQTDGNFVVYGIRNGNMTALWNAGTHVNGSGTYRLELGDDSVLKVKRNGNTVWSSPNTPINSDPYGNLGWSWVFRGANPYKNISQRYSSSHLGIDSNAPSGTEIYSVTSGKVISSSGEGWNDSMGWYVAITTNSVVNNNKLTVRYLHMKSRSSLRDGNSVTSSSLIGYVGNTGDSSGNHLHFDVNTINTQWGNNFNINNTINPELFFPNIKFTYNS